MDELINYLQRTLLDEVFSKDDKRTFKLMVQEKLLDTNQLNFLRSKIFELANTTCTPTNYGFIIEWIKTATSALVLPTTQPTSVFFSPGDACRNAIIHHIDSAIGQLHILCVYHQ